MTIEYAYEKGACVPKRVHTIVVSTQRAFCARRATSDEQRALPLADSEDVTLEELREQLERHVVREVIPAELYVNTQLHLNPCGSFIMGGPHSDAGLTGRKIIVDTYGGWGAHGGGAFSGKSESNLHNIRSRDLRFANFTKQKAAVSTPEALKKSLRSLFLLATISTLTEIDKKLVFFR